MAKSHYAGTLLGQFIGCLWAAGASAASFTPLGYLPGFTAESGAMGVSADGRVVVGYSRGGIAQPDQAFRWTAEGGLVPLGYQPTCTTCEPYSIALGVSGDGSTVVGYARGSSGPDAVLWPSSGAIQSLGAPPTSVARAGSYDGSAVALYGGDGTGSPKEMFRWTSPGGLEPIGTGDPHAISADGSVIVGSRGVNDGGVSASEAVRWTRASGLTRLDDTPSDATFSTAAYGISADGSTVVGQASFFPAGMGRAARWTVSGQQLLAQEPGIQADSIAYAVSGDGSIIVGQLSNFPAGERAAIWTDRDTPQLLLDYLVANGAEGLAGWNLTIAIALSGDGSTVAGWGKNPKGKQEAFVANISPIPLPAAVWLLGTGLAGIGGRRWLRHKAA